MCCLSKRQLDFIRLMLEEEDYRPISCFSKKIKVSGKTLKKDLRSIRKYLHQYGVEILGKTGKGIRITPNAKANICILNDLNAAAKEMGKESLEVRRANILKKLLVYSNTYTSIQKLSEQYYVSKTSIVNDMKYIEKWLLQFNLTLEKIKQGTKIQGKETDIRKAIASLIQIHQGEREEIHLDGEFNRLLKINETTLNRLRELFELEDIIYVESLISNLEIKSNISISDIYYINLLTHILICIRRVREGIHIEENNIAKMIQTDTFEQYQQALHITKMINERYEINIGDCETYYIYQYLVSSRLNQIVKIEGIKEEDVSWRVVQLLTKHISDILGVDFTKEKELLDGLLLHIRPMLNRMEYNIQISNPLLEGLQQSYPQILGICRLSFGIICKKFAFKKISIDEVAYIAIYYQTMLLKLKKPSKVLVVCHSGYGTSQLLAAKLMRELSDLIIVDVVSLRKLENMDLEDIDYIISTVPIHIRKIPYIMISALLTEKDIQNIRTSFRMPYKRKGNGGYIDFFNQYLNGEQIIFFTEEESLCKEKIICQADLLPNLVVCLVEAKRETSHIRMEFTEDKLYGKKLKAVISDHDEQIMKKALSAVYTLSSQRENLEILLQSNTAEEVSSFFKERWMY